MGLIPVRSQCRVTDGEVLSCLVNLINWIYNFNGDAGSGVVAVDDEEESEGTVAT